jgi:hypothetical protein
MDWRDMRVGNEGFDEEGALRRVAFCAASRVLVSVGSFLWGAPTREDRIVCSSGQRG